MSRQVASAYTSPLQYAPYDCAQIDAERVRVLDRARAVAKKQDDTALVEGASVAVGALAFWPALFLVAGSDQAQELSRLKGASEALALAAADKGCAPSDVLKYGTYTAPEPSR